MACNTIQQAALLNILKNRTSERCQFGLLLGAGCSISSDIPSVSTMIAEWRNTIQRDELYEEKDLPVKGSSSEYGDLFEILYHNRSQRRDYIETVVAGKKPYWGYASLVALLEARIFNTVMTTNFDDLILEACYTYSSILRPIVYHPDIRANTFSITGERCKLVKLHGDYLYDSLHNTTAELASLEANMGDILTSVSREYGLIVVGYSGRDKSIMTPIMELLKDNNSFRHGIYWCHVGDDCIDVVKSLAVTCDRFKLVKIDSFDGLMVHARQYLNVPKASALSDPIRTSRSRLMTLAEARPNMDNVHLVKEISDFATSLEEDLHSDVDLSIWDDLESLPRYSQTKIYPYGLLARNAAKDNRHDDAYKYAKRNYESVKLYSDKDSLVDLAIRDLFKYSGKTTSTISDDELYSKVEDSIELYIREPAGLFNLVVDAINDSRYELASKLLEKSNTIQRTVKSNRYSNAYYQINKAQLLMWQEKEVPTDQLDILANIVASSQDLFERYGAAVILKDLDTVKTCLDSFDEEQKKEVETWPIHRLFLKYSTEN